MADDDDARDREALRSAIPRPAADAADTLLAALHRARLAESLFGEADPVKVDRYIIRRELGRGGMGVVFVAEDPLLAVPVALKLLHHGRPGAGDSAAESQLQREAQALARVRGDHVVRVYSAGFFMGQPWIAMQLVDGPHLGEWLQARSKLARPDWREILARYVEAGRGLQAIHAAGLVHRDFKPQNAVVDADGCVKVLDFGLAVGASEPSSADAPRLGTHRYAAPEQFLGRDQGPASDQFSFCVALHEALTGAPPFGDKVSTGERLASDPAAKPPRPAGELPGWLSNALLRGLAARPEDRHPDMTALLHELTRDRRRNLRVAALLGAGFLLGGALVFLLGRPGSDDRCDAVATDDWNAERLQGRLPADELARVDHRIRDQRARWQASLATLCTATPRPDEATLTLRHACLANARTTFIAVLTRGYATPTKLADALIELPVPEHCLAPAAGPQAPSSPPSPELVAQVETALAEAEAARLYGDHTQAKVHVDQVRQLVAGSEDLLAARVAFAYASIAREADERDAAFTTLGRALRLARQPDPALAVEILHEQVRLALLTYRSPRDGIEEIAEAAEILGKLGPDVPGDRLAMLRAEHHDMRGLLYIEALRYQDALTEHDQAIAAWQQMPSRPDVQRRLYESLHARARVHAELGDRPAAIADDREALRVAGVLHGPVHPALVDLYLALARDLASHGDTAEAKTTAGRASELLRTRKDGGVRSRCELAALTRDLGDPVSAEAEAREAARLAAEDPRSDPRERGDCDYLVAMLAVANESADADTRLQRAIDSLEGAPGSQADCDRAVLQATLGLLLIQRGDLQGAEVAVRNDPPPDCSAQSLHLWAQAQISEHRGDIDAAEQRYLAALALPSDQHAQQQLELAQLLHKHKPGDPRIRQLAGEAAPALARQGYAAEAADAAALAR